MASLEGGGYLTIHLGMTGKLLLGGLPANTRTRSSPSTAAYPLYDDSRQFGCIEFNEEFPARVARLGRSRSKSRSRISPRALCRARRSIKALLLNQTFLRGHRQYLCG